MLKKIQTYARAVINIFIAGGKKSPPASSRRWTGKPGML